MSKGASTKGNTLGDLATKPAKPENIRLSLLRKPKGSSKYAVKRLDPPYQKPHVYNYDDYTGLWMFMPAMEMWYDSFQIQMAVAGLIFANFITSAGRSQQIADQEAGTVFIYKIFEYFFTYIFSLELVVNMYAHGWSFWTGEQAGWNLFDFIVVSVSLLSLVTPNLPGISVLRLLRAFRVFRLFKRLKSLRQIIKALEASIPGVANAFAILLLVIGIYAILGVEFFRKSSPEYFSTFAKSMFSLFQVMTGESWAEMVARPVMDGMAPNCIVEYQAPMRPTDQTTRYPWELRGRYSVMDKGKDALGNDINNEHPDYVALYSGLRPHYVGTFNCYVDDAALLKNDGKREACNAGYEEQVRKVCKGVMRLQTTENWEYNNGEAGGGSASWQSVKYVDGTTIGKDESYINTLKPFKIYDNTILPDATAEGMDPSKGDPERFESSGLTWKKTSLWLRPKDPAKGYSTKVFMEGLVRTGKKDGNGDPVPCQTGFPKAGQLKSNGDPELKYEGNCEPDGKLHWYTYEDYIRNYAGHNYCGRTTSNSEGIHTNPKAGGPPGVEKGDKTGIIDRVTGYYPEVMKEVANTCQSKAVADKDICKALTEETACTGNTKCEFKGKQGKGDCASTVKQIIGDVRERVTRKFGHTDAIAAAQSTDTKFGKIACTQAQKDGGHCSGTSQGLAGYVDARFPNTAGAPQDTLGYQYGQIPCPLYMQKDPPIVREARCYDYYLGMGKEECQNHCLPQGLGSIYFVTFTLFCGYMLVNVAISIVIEKMMEKEDDDEHPERVYEVLQMPDEKTMVIMLASQDERTAVLDELDPKHDYFCLPGQEIWLFNAATTLAGEAGGPDITAFTPIVIASVEAGGGLARKSSVGDGSTMTYPEATKDIRQILEDRYVKNGDWDEDQLNDACKRTVTITLAESVMSCPVMASMSSDLKATNDDVINNWLKDVKTDIKVLIEPPPPTVDESHDDDPGKGWKELRADIDTLFIDVTYRLSKILNEVNALEYRVCAMDSEMDVAGGDSPKPL